jgi:hypothetical protein
MNFIERFFAVDGVNQCLPLFYGGVADLLALLAFGVLALSVHMIGGHYGRVSERVARLCEGR